MKRILIIDDNRSIHDDFRKILSPVTAAATALNATEAALFGRAEDMGRPAQFEVDSAYQGQEGLLLVQQALAAGRPYALAFVDVRMPPGWDGVETIRKIWEVDPELQVVLCTAYSDYSWGELFVRLGQRDGLLILKKPFDAVEAFQLAYALTEKWRLHQQARQTLAGLEQRVAERTRELQGKTAALVETSALIETLLENTADGIYFKDLQSRFVHFSRRMLDLFHLAQPAELKGKTDFDFFFEEHARAAFEAEQKIIRTGEPMVNLEEEENHRDGRVTWVLTSKMPWRDPAGKIIGTMGISRDITERKRLEAQLFQSLKMETVGRLAGGVAHEFNSLLTVIIGQGEMLRSDLPAWDPLGKNAAKILEAAERAATLTRQLLAYGRKQMLQPEILDLNAVLTGMESTLRHLLAGGGGAALCLSPAVGLKGVLADAEQMELVITNLAMNAAEAMPHGGLLTLATANLSLDQEYVRAVPELKAGDYVMLAIADTGTGMNDETKAHIFEPFFTTKGVGQGTGLGLSTCYGIIKQSGGHISVETAPGRGTTFKIFLPQVAAPPQPSMPLPDSADLPRGTETILLVEADPALRELAASWLRRLGYTVLAAANGLEALSLKHPEGRSRIDLLFTDLVMPHLSGLELSERVRALCPQARILFAAAHHEPATVPQGAARLQKPYPPSALARKLREVLDQPGAPQPAIAPPAA